VKRERIVSQWEDDPFGAAPTTATALPKRGVQPFKPTQLPSVLGSPVAYVIVTSDNMAAEFQRLADWKTQAGVPAVVRTLSFIRQEYNGTDDADRIRRFLRDAYARWGTKWALLGGDTDVIPTRVAWTRFYVMPPQTYNDIPTDLYYSCLDGNWNADGDSLYGEGDLSGTIKVDNCDLLPEIWVGRAPAANATEAHRFVDKVFQYSRTPVGDYENRIAFFAEVMDPQDWTPGDFIVLDGAALAEECLPYVKSDPAMGYGRLYENYLDPSYEPGALQLTRARALDSLEVGYNLAVHCGHGFRNVMSLGDSNATNADFLALNNGNRLINFYAVDCTSNAIDYPCLGEAFLKASNGGGVSSIGSTRLDFPSTGRVYQKEYFRLMFQAGVTAIGEAQGRQKLPYVSTAITDNTQRWTQMTLLLLGDPEMHLWTARPRSLAVTKPASLSASDTTLAVHVTVGGAALAGALVTAYKAGDDYSSGTTDASGNVVLDFRPDGGGSAMLTVTAFNCVPYQTPIVITAAAGPLLVEGTVAVDDDNSGGTSGNGDGVLDSGETVDLTVPVRNTGGTSSSSVTGKLTTTSPAVTMITSGVTYGTIAAGATVNGATRFRFTTAYNSVDQIELPFSLSIVDGAAHHFVEPIRLTLHAPELMSYAHVYTEISGNGNGVPEAGEVVSETVTLRNSGSGVARGVSVVLRNHDGLATVTDSTASYGDIAAGATKNGDALAFNVIGAGAKFELRISTSQGLLSTQTLDLVAPATPINLASRGFVNLARLTWNANAAPDLIGYNIYRSAAAGGPYTLLNSIPADRSAYYVDEGLTPLTRYYYQASAVDSAGNESGRSATISVSTTPPNHAVFPIAMGGNSSSAVTIARAYVHQPKDMDIFAGADHLYVWFADGTAPVDADGSPLTSGDFTELGSNYAAGAAVADLDGGGFEIIAPTWNDQSLYVFDTQGQVKAGFPFVASTPIWSTPAIGDLDKDGKKEIVFASNGNLLYALRWNGTEWMDGDANPSTPGVFKTLGFNFNYGTPAIADLDHDGFPEIVFASFDHNLYAWHANGTNVTGFPIMLAGASNSSVAIGMLDGPSDTQPEIVAAGGDSLYVFEPSGARRPGFPVALKVSGGTGKQPSPALADMNGDGYLDIVAAGTDGRLYAYDRNGVLFAAFANVRFSALTDAATESSPVVADINGDGSPDIVIGDDNATLSAFDNQGRLLAGFPIALGGEIKGTPALCDCDGDGMSEIVAVGWDGQLYFWDYDFPFSPNGPSPWPQFHHDAMHTGFASPESTVTVPAADTPKVVSLAIPYPNPARSGAAFVYEIPAAKAGARFSLDVFDLAGRHVRRLASGPATVGRFTAPWDLRGAGGTRVGGGMYLVVLDVGGERITRRLVAMP
jgi:hypothetical protein